MLPYITIDKKINNENEFRDWYNSKLRMYGYWVYTIRNVEILTEKPFDSIGATPDGQAIAIEYKMINHRKSNIRDKLRPVQRKNLKTFTGHSFVIIYNRTINDYKIIDFKDIENKTVLIFN